ncbi:uncharacterized protein MAM_00919 [Metarhizium album ARSEF 1941]|uniref:Fungal specific transcription factor n=1 Tax=Metarhizium album (strain ARSEF 1941) TaxID=1081103 RepID=A0A0B2X829_METAS|nr:uncharacterized protein MAM_00919 [Metarhizium album ARSEF 1941]KHO01918.1 hypothetical protein MAM_00919 [Metarhizium album ARSEF 1941]
MSSANTAGPSPTSYSSSSSPSETPSRQSPSPGGRALPAPGDNSATTLDVSGHGTTVKLDHLGPLVVNVDGTVSRISNWPEMGDVEKQNTLRVLGRRNKQRLAALRAAGDKTTSKQDS